MDKHFTDREEFRNDIIELLEKYQHGNIVYILSGKSGFGKSAFGQHIIDMFKGTYLCIKVKMLVGEKISLDEGFYFRRITMEVSSKSNLYGYPSFSEFFKNASNPLIQKLYTRQIEQDLATTHPFMDMAVNFYRRNDPMECFSEYQNLFPEDSRYIYMLLGEYLFECFKYPKRVILNIENVQNIDKLSLLKLIELIKRCTNLFLLLEFTSTTNSLIEAKNFEENFYDCGAYVITKNLKKLNYKSTCEILEYMYPDIDSIKREEVKRSIFITIDGNIRQLSDIDSIYELSDNESERNIVCSNSTDYTLTRLENLKDNNQIMLLCFVIAHMGKVDISVLKEMIRRKQYLLYLNFDNIVEMLSGSNGLLKTEHSQILVSHDSIPQRSNEIPLLKNRISLGYTIWIEYYENQLTLCEEKNIHSKTELVKKLCYFYNKYPPRSLGIIHLFQDIRKIALNSQNPEEAIAFLSTLGKNVQYCDTAELSNKIKNFLLKIYYESGLYKDAYSLLEDSKFMTDKSYILYKAILNNRLQKNEEAIEICNSAIEKYSKDERFVLCANLIILISAASKNDYKLCEEIFNDCISRQEFKNCYEYGFLLRNSEIVLPLQEAIPFLEQSAIHFKSYNAPIMEAHSRVSLLMNCSRIGFFGKAAENLLITKRLLHEESLERYILLNDEVAFQMCMGDFNPKLQDDLMLAMCTATTVFPKLIINKNLLILYTKNKEWSKGEEIVQYLLEQINLETNRLNICFTYWNISYFYKQFDPVQYEIYFNEYQRAYNELMSKPLRKSVLQRNMFHKPGNEFVIEFLSYWHFPIPDLI